MTPPTKYKAYLGDAVYADYDGYHIVLTAENGQRVIERICLDDQVWVSLMRWHTRLLLMLSKGQANTPPEVP